MDPFAAALNRGCRNRRWGPGLTALTAWANLGEFVSSGLVPRLLEHGVRALEAAPEEEPGERLFPEGLDRRQMADFVFTAATDERYPDALLDSANKAMEALDRVGWEGADRVLGSLAFENPRRRPDVLESAFERLPRVLERSRELRGAWAGDRDLLEALQRSSGEAVEGMLEALADGASEEDLAIHVVYVAALRDHRVLVFANAVHQGLRRLTSPEELEGHPALLRGLFDAAVQLGPGPLPALPDEPMDPEGLLEALQAAGPEEAARLVGGYLLGGGSPDPLLARLVEVLAAEVRDLPTVQAVEAAVQQYRFRRNTPEGVHLLQVAARRMKETP